MILYHGSNVVVEQPEILKPSHALDFGSGFYTTLNRDQAVDRRMKNISGRAVYELFRATGADEYVRNCYCALHTTGERYILVDVDEYIQAQFRFLLTVLKL